MVEKKNRPRFLLIFQIAAIFGAAMVFAFIIIFVATSKLLMDRSAQRGLYVANAAAISAVLDFGDREDFTTLTEEDVKELQEDFYLICQVLSIKYLYLYDIDKDGNVTYYICGAGDIKDHLEMIEENYYGKVRHRDLVGSEKKILEGTQDILYEFVDNDYGNVCMYLVPLTKTATDERVAILGVDLEMDWVLSESHKSRQIMLIAGFATFIIAIFVSLALVERSVLSPITNLSKRMEGFVKDRNRTPAKRDTVFSNEITDMEESFDKMAEEIHVYVEDIEKMSLERAHARTQLDVAKRIQCGMVPSERSMAGDGYEIFGSENPAREVGGDFYDFFELDDNRICMVVGDISGKGVSAALFMVMVKTVIRETIKMGKPLAETMTFVNEEICSSNPEFMFATVFAAIIDRTTGEMQYVNAGHEPPLYLGKEIRFLEVQSGTALGLYDDAEMAYGEMQLSDGEGLLIYTDGVTDSLNAENVRYGKERLLSFAKENYSKADNICEADVLVKNLVKSVNEYAEGQNQFDDITCVTVLYRNNEMDQKSMSPNLKSYANIKRTIINALGTSDQAKNVILACEEIFTNVINYSGADIIRYSCEQKEGIYSVTFKDNGIPFDPASAQIKEKDFDELDSGGMGILLARKISKEMIYNRINDFNCLTLKFDVPNDKKT